MHQGQIVFNLLFKAHRQLAKAVVPGVRALYHPAPRRMSPPAWPQLPLSLATDVGNITPLPPPLIDLRVIVTLIQTQVLRVVGCYRGPWGHDRIQSGESRLHVMAVGGGDRHRQRRPALVGQDMPLGAGFASVRGVGTRLRPPKGAFTMALSKDWKRHWIPRHSSYRASSFAHNFSNTPARSHAWKRLWQGGAGGESPGTALP